jgi:hypothetical protein
VSLFRRRQFEITDEDLPSDAHADEFITLIDHDGADTIPWAESPNEVDDDPVERGRHSRLARALGLTALVAAVLAGGALFLQSGHHRDGSHEHHRTLASARRARPAPAAVVTGSSGASAPKHRPERTARRDAANKPTAHMQSRPRRSTHRRASARASSTARQTPAPTTAPVVQAPAVAAASPAPGNDEFGFER